MAVTSLTDSCFWLGLVDRNDQYHREATAIFELIVEHRIIIPWPCLYETLSTHLARRREKLLELERILSKDSIFLLDDSKYKEKAKNLMFEQSRIHGYTYSLTDSIIREVLKDINVKVDYLITFNNRDFSDICSKRSIEILDN